MGKLDRSLDYILEITKQVIQDKKLTIKELADNIEAEEQIIEILLNPNNDVVGALSRLIELTNVRLRYVQKPMKVYKIYDNGAQLKIRRTLKPFCWMYFNRATQEFYNFEQKFKREKISTTTKEIIISEMADEVELYLDS